tara:strand:+ start:1088 stop:3058 length:1971 start_codon:yes stop_codon:yes gene_type:complete
MGKKGKKDKRRVNDLKIDESVSILTPTTASRKNFLLILAKCIAHQTYLSKIKQWVIVSADTKWNQKELDEIVSKIQNLPKTIKIDAVFITPQLVIDNKWDICENTDSYQNIGYLRNITNILATGDYIVPMDDDDYYPPLRVETAVTALRRNNVLVAGCSPHIMYESDIDEFYQFKKFGQNHTINNSIAYKKKYIEDGAKYDNYKSHAEERGFLKDYKVPLVQLSPENTVIQMCHHNNTYNKRKLIVQAEWAPPNKGNITKLSSKNTKNSKYIPDSFLNEYKVALNYVESCVSKYDIVYYCGTNGNIWSPYDKNLGGSEQAVKHLTESWTKLGLNVAVYGEFIPEVTKQTLSDSSTGDFFHFGDFSCSTKYKNLIIWRNFGMRPLLSWPIKADKIYIDIHDLNALPEVAINNIHKIDKFFLKSSFHSTAFTRFHNNFDKIPEYIKNNSIIIKNGVRISEFRKNINNVKRDPYRFCWCSYYTRGLMPILKYLWPFIKDHEPRASFHIYYGMDMIPDAKFKAEMEPLLKQAGVTDHGRKDINTIINEKYLSTFHLYFSKTAAETDCISIRESTVAGCVPIISQYNVFGERDGLRFPGDPDKPEDMKKLGIQIINLLEYKDDKIERFRKKIMNNEIDWEQVAIKWKNIIYGQCPPDGGTF